MNEANFYENFDGKWILQGNLRLVAKESASSFAKYICEKEARLLGIDGFTLAEGLTKPSLEWIVDYSGTGQPSYESICEFLVESSPYVTHYEFVLRV